MAENSRRRPPVKESTSRRFGRLCLLGVLFPFSLGLSGLSEGVAEPAWLDRPSALAQVRIPTGMSWTLVRAASAGGDVAVAWWDEVDDGRGGSYRATIVEYGSSGRAASFELSGRLTRCFGRPGLDFLDGAGALAAWVCRRPHGPGWVLQVRRFGRSGPHGAAPMILAGSDDDAIRDPIVVDGAGEGGLVLWRSTIGASNRGTLYGQVVDGQGRPLGSATALGGARLGGAETPPAAVALQGGGYLVAWVAAGQVVAQRLDAGGVPASVPAVVNEGGTASSETPALAAAGSGRGAVAWLGRAESSVGTSLWARWVGPGGRPSSPVLSVAAGDRYGGRPIRPAELAAGPEGDLLAVWRNPSMQEGGGPGIFGRWFDGTTGLPLERPFLLDEGRGGDWPHLGRWSESGMVLSWLTESQAGTAAGAGTTVELEARLILPRRPGRVPRTWREVECEGSRLRDAMADVEVVREGRAPSLLAGTAGGGRELVAVAAVALPGDGRDGRTAQEEPSWKWSEGASQRFLLTPDPQGELGWRPVGPEPDSPIRLSRGNRRGSAEPGEDAAPPGQDAPPRARASLSGPCHGKRTKRDVELALGLIGSLRPSNPSGEYVLTAFRGPGVDTFWVELLSRDHQGTFANWFGVSARFEWDGGGELRGLELSALPACTGSRRIGCTKTDRLLGLEVKACPPQVEACESGATIRSDGQSTVRLQLSAAGDPRSWVRDTPGDFRGTH